MAHLPFYRCPSTCVVCVHAGCSSVVDVALLLDLSGSVEYELVTEFARALVLELQVNTDAVRVAVVTFADNVTRVIMLDEFVAQQRNLIETLNFQQVQGKTNIQVTPPSARSTPSLRDGCVASSQAICTLYCVDTLLSAGPVNTVS